MLRYRAGEKQHVRLKTATVTAETRWGNMHGALEVEIELKEAPSCQQLMVTVRHDVTRKRQQVLSPEFRISG